MASEETESLTESYSNTRSKTGSEDRGSETESVSIESVNSQKPPKKFRSDIFELSISMNFCNSKDSWTLTNECSNPWKSKFIWALVYMNCSDVIHQRCRQAYTYLCIYVLMHIRTPAQGLVCIICTPGVYTYLRNILLQPTMDPLVAIIIRRRTKFLATMTFIIVHQCSPQYLLPQLATLLHLVILRNRLSFCAIIIVFH